MILTRIYGYGCIALLISTVAFFALWQHADGEIGRREGVVAKAQIAALDAANKRAAKLQRKLDTLPRPSNKIREVVRENPSGCVLRPAVVDSVRQAIREANAARKVP